MSGPVLASIQANATARVQNFAAMSAGLCGFRLEIIAPSYDPVDLKTLYLNTTDQRAGQPQVDALIALYLSLQGKPAQQISDALLETQNPTPSPTAILAQTLVKLWYLGIWYGANNSAEVISANAYIGGLTWKAAQAHPMGYSEFMFGYWNQPPAPLSSFGLDLQGDNNND